MIRINLLPHRALKRKALQRQFFVIAAAVALFGAGIWFIVHSLFVDRIEDQVARNQYLEQKIVELDKQIEGVMKNAGVIGAESPPPRIMVVSRGWWKLDEAA